LVLNVVIRVVAPEKSIVPGAWAAPANVSATDVGVTAKWFGPSVRILGTKSQAGIGGLIPLETALFSIPDAQMNAQERACCRTMKNQCGQMEMPASHGCCQKTPLSVHDNALDTKTVAFHPAAVAVIRLAASELLPSTSIVAEWVDSPEYSPPQSPPSTVSILRI
jgi:hypothetical protein